MAVERAARAGWSGGGLIAGTGDVARVLREVNAVGLRRDRTTALAQAVRTADDVELTAPDATRVLPLAAELHPLVPWPGGLRRGATVAAIGSTSLVLMLLAEAMAAGSWAAVVGLPQLGALAAAADYGIDLARLALVPDPGPQWPEVVGALIDGVDLVVVATTGAVPEATVRSLAGRARQRGVVLVPTSAAWPGCDVVLEVTDRRWTGLGAGRGRLRRQHVTVRATGRGRSARPAASTSPCRRRPPPPGRCSRAPAPTSRGNPARRHRDCRHRPPPRTRGRRPPRWGHTASRPRKTRGSR